MQEEGEEILSILTLVAIEPASLNNPVKLKVRSTLHLVQ